MPSRTHTRPAASSSAAIDAVMVKTLHLLLKAHDRARDLRRDDWDLAVELPSVLTAGGSTVELRWLLYQEHIAVALETTPPGQAQRTFQPIVGLPFAERTCFVLTRSGIALARNTLPRFGAAVNGILPAPEEIPYWDDGLGELRLGGVLVKRFRQKARLQRLILNAFQEQGWPWRIDNPIPRHPEKDDREQLHTAVWGLNHCQCNPLLRFSRDGTSEGVCWQRLPAVAADRNGHA